VNPARWGHLLGAVSPPELETATPAGLTWSDGATVVAAAVAALIAAVVAVYGYSRQQQASRRDQRAVDYAEALRAVEDYLEAPYLIQRRDGTTQVRQSTTDRISNVQSRIRLHESWLAILAPAGVHTAYTAFTAAARTDAGPQMTAAWEREPSTRDVDVPIRHSYDRSSSDTARSLVQLAMREDLVRSRRSR